MAHAAETHQAGSEEADAAALKNHAHDSSASEAAGNAKEAHSQGHEATQSHSESKSKNTHSEHENSTQQVHSNEDTASPDAAPAKDSHGTGLGAGISWFVGVFAVVAILIFLFT